MNATSFINHKIVTKINNSNGTFDYILEDVISGNRTNLLQRKEDYPMDAIIPIHFEQEIKVVDEKPTQNIFNVVIINPLNNIKMKAQATKINTQALKNGTATVASGVLGTGHFIFDSLAKTCLAAEKSIVNKLTGESKEDIAKRRIETTNQVQQKIIITTKATIKKVNQSSAKSKEAMMKAFGPMNEIKSSQA